jgi:hypothetical protein
VTAVYDLLEGAPLGIHDGAEWTVSGIAESKEVRRFMTPGYTEDLSARGDVPDGRMPAADPEVGRCEHHEYGRLPEIVLIENTATVVLGSGQHERDCHRRASYVFGSLPDSREFLQL